MAKRGKDRDPIAELLDQGADGERRLLRRERRAERGLGEAQAALADEIERLARVQGRIERLAAAVAAAEADLRTAQAARAAGPGREPLPLGVADGKGDAADGGEEGAAMPQPAEPVPAAVPDAEEEAPAAAAPRPRRARTAGSRRAGA